MKVCILGTGQVGQALAAGFLGTGHEVFMGTRDPESTSNKELERRMPEIHLMSFTDAAAKGELMVLATKWDGTEEALNLARTENLNGKVLIDVTNPLKNTDHGIELERGWSDSGGEAVQRWVSGAKVVKCWNMIGNKFMYQPHFEEGDPDMFICGDDAEAKAVVTQILRDFGWGQVVDFGGIKESRLLEPLCILWVKYGMLSNNWKHAFKMLKN